MLATHAVATASLPSLLGPPDATAEFESTLVKLLPQVARQARRLTAQPADAEDLVQETYRRALESRRQFAPRSNLGAWLLCILRNYHRDCLRRSRREISFGDGLEELAVGLPADPVPSWKVVGDEDVDLALAALPIVFRQTYTLFTVEKLNYRQIASRLGIPIGTVGTRLRRTRRWLRGFLSSDRPAQGPD
jgi:RNA polymerase sigma-70 factor (ECF subfamily)